jgi:hypothetical protein
MNPIYLINAIDSFHKRGLSCTFLSVFLLVCQYDSLKRKTGKLNQYNEGKIKGKINVVKCFIIIKLKERLVFKLNEFNLSHQRH